MIMMLMILEADGDEETQVYLTSAYDMTLIIIIKLLFCFLFFAEKRGMRKLKTLMIVLRIKR